MPVPKNIFKNDNFAGRVNILMQALQLQNNLIMLKSKINIFYFSNLVIFRNKLKK